jgi:hypothetical protein
MKIRHKQTKTLKKNSLGEYRVRGCLSLEIKFDDIWTLRVFLEFPATIGVFIFVDDTDQKKTNLRFKTVRSSGLQNERFHNRAFLPLIIFHRHFQHHFLFRAAIHNHAFVLSLIFMSCRVGTRFASFSCHQMFVQKGDGNIHLSFHCHFDTVMSESASDSDGGEHASPLLGRDKVALGCQINRGALTTAAVELRYNVARRTAQKYATVIKKGGCLYDKGGRPSTIDSIGIQEVADFIVRNPDSSTDTIRAMLRTAHVNTLKRRRPDTFDSSDDEYERISRVSVWRYERKAHDLAHRTLCFDDNSSTDESAGQHSDEDNDCSDVDDALNDGGGGDDFHDDFHEDDVLNDGSGGDDVLNNGGDDDDDDDDGYETANDVASDDADDNHDDNHEGASVSAGGCVCQ